VINEIMTASGIPFRQGRFYTPPAETYAITFDDHEVRGPDVIAPGASVVIRHDCMVELYEPRPDPEAEAAIEAALLSRSITWTKEDRYWLQNMQRYQVVYEFSYNEKRRT
jgi:hypothetical protein